MASVDAPLTYRERPARGDADGLLILHHGRGADEHDLFPLADVFDPAGRLHVVTPRAPLSLPGAPGYHWYVVPRVGYPDPPTFQAAYRQLAAFHDALWERLRFHPANRARRLLDGDGDELRARPRAGPAVAGGDPRLLRLHPDRRRLAAGPRRAPTGRLHRPRPKRPGHRCRVRADRTRSPRGSRTERRVPRDRTPATRSTRRPSRPRSTGWRRGWAGRLGSESLPPA